MTGLVPRYRSSVAIASRLSRICGSHFSTARESPRYRSDPRSTHIVTLSARIPAISSVIFIS
jgi:hypothetical protein